MYGGAAQAQAHCQAVGDLCLPSLMGIAVIGPPALPPLTGFCRETLLPASCGLASAQLGTSRLSWVPVAWAVHTSGLEA